jgi:hypothetical protein
MADKPPIFRIFKDRPTRFFLDEFRDHIRKTNQPEIFAGLHRGPISKSARFQKLLEFTVDQQKRPQKDKVPCPMCQPNKFLNGWLIYLPDLQAVAAIGHCCADQENLAAADRRYKDERLRDYEEDYLLANLPFVEARLATLLQVRLAAEEARRIYLHFRGKGSEFQKALRKVKEHSGLLTITEEIAGEIAAYGPSGLRSSGSTRQTRDIVCGRLEGSTALIAEYNPVKELDLISNWLNGLRCEPTTEAALNWIIGLSAKERHSATVLLKEADDRFANFQKRIRDFCAFFDRDNIARIDTWGSHPQSPYQFRASIGDDRGRRICSFERMGTAFRVVLNPVLWRYEATWPAKQQQ